MNAVSTILSKAFRLLMTVSAVMKKIWKKHLPEGTNVIFKEATEAEQLSLTVALVNQLSDGDEAIASVLQGRENHRQSLCRM